MDHICDSFSTLGVGIDDRDHVGGRDPCPAGHRHYSNTDPGASRTKTGVTRLTFARQGELFKIAVEITRTVKGVESVKNDLIVK